MLGPERRGQDHVHQPDAGPAPADGRPGAALRPAADRSPRPQPRGRDAAGVGHHRRAHGARADRALRHLLSGSAAHRPGHRHGRPRGQGGRARRRRSRAASASVSTSPWPSAATPTSSSSTSPPSGWTSRPAAPSSRASRRSPPRARPSCSPPTISVKPRSWPGASWSSITGSIIADATPRELMAKVAGKRVSFTVPRPLPAEAFRGLPLTRARPLRGPGALPDQ